MGLTPPTTTTFQTTTGSDNGPVGHTVRERVLRARRVLPRGVPRRADAHQPGDHRPALGAVQPQPVQRRQGVPLGAEHLARPPRGEVERAHLQFPTGLCYS